MIKPSSTSQLLVTFYKLKKLVAQEGVGRVVYGRESWWWTLHLEVT